MNLLMSVIEKNLSWEASRMGEIQFLEQLAKFAKPTTEGKGDHFWYAELKRYTNQLAFNILLEDDSVDAAFKYSETTGIDYLEKFAKQGMIILRILTNGSFHINRVPNNGLVNTTFIRLFGILARFGKFGRSYSSTLPK